MRALVVLLVVVAAGCFPKVQYRQPGPEVDRAATVVNAPFEKTWNAVIDVFARENTPIQTLEKASGFVVAERAVIPWSEPAEYLFALSLADCGAIYNPQTGRWREYPPTTAKYNIVVRPQGDKSTVRVNAKFLSVTPVTSTPLNPTSRECTSKAKYETVTEAAIKRAAETGESPLIDPSSTTPRQTSASATVAPDPTDARPLNVTIRVRFLERDSSATPVPDLALNVISERGDTTASARTNGLGVANLALPAGRYRVVSGRAADYVGRRYEWDVTFGVRMGMGPVDLTQRNARTKPANR
jgi:hypothetical protein